MFSVKHFTIATIILLSSCQKDTSDKRQIFQSPSKLDSIGSFHPFSVLDSLEKYSGIDSMYLEKENGKKLEMLFISKANDVPFGVRMKYDDSNSSIVFYQKSNNVWRATDTIENEAGAMCYFNRVDLNADKMKDIKISLPEGSHGNYQSIVFLFDPKTRAFKNNIYYDLLNVEYDTVDKFIRSSVYASVAGCQDKMKYKIVADSLVFDLGVTYCPDDILPAEKASLEYFKMRNGDRIIMKSRKGNPKKLWKEFEQAFWDSSNE